MGVQEEGGRRSILLGTVCSPSCCRCQMQETARLPCLPLLAPGLPFPPRLSWQHWD